MSNIYEADIKSFNCMGYAFNTPNMVEPSGAWCMDEMIEDWYGELIINEESIQIALENIVDNMLYDYKYLIEVNDPDSFPPETEVIAFKCAMNKDADRNFHFKVRRNGIWSEKLGDENIQECELFADKPWDSEDCMGYIWSKIVYFVWDETVSKDFINKVIANNVEAQHEVYFTNKEL